MTARSEIQIASDEIDLRLREDLAAADRQFCLLLGSFAFGCFGIVLWVTLS